MLGTPDDLVAKLKAKPGGHISYQTVGPNNEPLRARAQQYQLQGRKAPVIFLAGEDQSSVNRDVRDFVLATAWLFIYLPGRRAWPAAGPRPAVRVGLPPLLALRNEDVCCEGYGAG